MFQCLTPYHGGIFTFGGNKKGRTTRVGKIVIHPYPSIDNILFFEGLKHNMLSISQLCDYGYDVSFNKDECVVKCKDRSSLFSTKRKGNLYKIKLRELLDQNVSCLLSAKENHWLWYKKLGHASWRLIFKPQKNNILKGLPSMPYNDGLLCETCQKGKQIENSSSSKNTVSTSRPLQLLHLDLFSPTRIVSTSGKRYGLVIVDDQRQIYQIFICIL